MEPDGETESDRDALGDLDDEGDCDADADDDTDDDGETDGDADDEREDDGLKLGDIEALGETPSIQNLAAPCSIPSSEPILSWAILPEISSNLYR